MRGEKCEDFDLVEELAQHLADGEIAVLVEAGAEKLRYITGDAVAVRNRTQIKLLENQQVGFEGAYGQRPGR